MSNARTQESFDSLTGWKVFAGKAKLGRDVSNKVEGGAALFLNNGQNDQESWARKFFSGPRDFSRVDRFLIHILQEGNLLGNTIPWRMRLVSDSKNYYERVFPLDRVSAATAWCEDSSSPADWTATGKPDWSRITGIEIQVPNYVGGARNRVGYDSFRTA